MPSIVRSDYIDEYAAKVFKENLLLVADEHREHCIGEDCPISLSNLYYMACYAGIKFTKEEVQRFV